QCPADLQAELVRCGLILPATKEEKQLGRPAAAVENGSLGIARLKRRVVARQPAVAQERARPECAMIEVERMAARDERPFIEERLPGTVEPEQRQRQPAVPADQ